jgi:hypothetical protein
VLTTLSVDELVWGTAQTENGSTTVTVHRVAKGEPARQQIAVVDETGGVDAVSESMQPLFARDEAGSGSATGSEGLGSATGRPHTKSFFDTRERKMGVGFGAGSLACLIIGLSQWSGQSGLQDQIDSHPTMTLDQLQDLHRLEERAGSKALWGNVFVVLGVGLGAVSGYYFWKDSKNRSEAVVAPVPTEDGTGVKMVLGGRW